MKGIFSVTTFLALASALVSGAPLSERSSYTVPASDLWVITNPAPATVVSTPPALLGQVSIADGSNEIDTVVSFDMSIFPPPTAASTCQFLIQNVTPSGSGIVQLFTLGGEVTSSATPIIPFYNQYEGQYNVNTSPSTPIDVQYVPCNFFADGSFQFVIRPQNTDDFLSWTQTASVGAFIEYTP
jgi:hypothetical protein